MFLKLTDALYRVVEHITNNIPDEDKKQLDNAVKPRGLQDPKRMRTSELGMIELIGHEGICMSKYKCSSGVWTIGAGATKTELPDLPNWPLHKTLTMPEVLALFRKSLRRYELAISNALKVEVKQHVFDALVSWCYNVGVGWARKATVIKLINQGVTDPKRLYNALMRYNKPKAIIGRRRKEALLLSTGRYQNQGRALIFPVKNGYPRYSLGKSVNVHQLLIEDQQ